MTTAALVWCPFPDEDTAIAAIHALLDERLIACGNVLPGMTSVFIWNGTRDTTRETGALLKTNADLLDRAVLRLAELHPYEEPAVLGWRCDTGAPGTLAWLANIVSNP
ncbi:divalent-cation tolerance protein CutA [Novosphingobium mangrovi (ex Huang et al. 2023)]|uniref:Divalent-cation tolerance protein CutA n=1 Tax=Novosphingobium mangrovi (ex Huang et al. 2023) TaxID=2976432 RepID=A0ABT2I8W4_9SPHN|nr:divalent-cation tolerance protein CutA [Novosphingobium mangrovi (ex Huang et al. 2023)]MCT2401270.1 divalent-cation tolerance protein CutA [Novosphingobium mangrovi (ex Huang et al. 2023)]